MFPASSRADKMHPKFYNTAGAGDFMHMNQYMSLSHHVQNLRFESGYNGHQVVLPNGIKAIVDRNLVRQLIKRESLDQMFQYSRTQASEDIRRLSEGDMECPPYQLFRNFNFASPFAAKDVPTARFHERLVLRSPEEMREIRKDLFENGKFIDDPYMEEAAYPPLPSLQPNKQWAAVARNTEEPVVWPQINPNRVSPAC